MKKFHHLGAWSLIVCKCNVTFSAAMCCFYAFSYSTLLVGYKAMRFGHRIHVPGWGLRSKFRTLLKSVFFFFFCIFFPFFLQACLNVYRFVRYGSTF